MASRIVSKIKDWVGSIVCVWWKDAEDQSGVTIEELVKSHLPIFATYGILLDINSERLVLVNSVSSSCEQVEESERIVIDYKGSNKEIVVNGGRIPTPWIQRVDLMRGDVIDTWSKMSKKKEQS